MHCLRENQIVARRTILAWATKRSSLNVCPSFAKLVHDGARQYIGLLEQEEDSDDDSEDKVVKKID